MVAGPRESADKVLGAESEAERKFFAWVRLTLRQLGHKEQPRSILNNWARIAYSAELERKVIGRELAKLQDRIGRQRRANRDLIETIGEHEATIDRLSQHTTHFRNVVGASEARIRALEWEVEQLRGIVDGLIPEVQHRKSPKRLVRKVLRAREILEVLDREREKRNSRPRER